MTYAPLEEGGGTATNPVTDEIMQQRLMNLVAVVWLREPHLTADAVVARITRLSRFKLPANVVRGAVVAWLADRTEAFVKAHPEGATTEDGGDAADKEE